MTPLSQQPDLTKLLKDLQASPFKFWIDRNACLSALQTLGGKAEPALGAVLKYLFNESCMVNASGVFRTVGPSARKWIPTLIREFQTKRKGSDGQEAVGIIYAMAFMSKVTDQYTDELKALLNQIVHNSKLSSGVRFCAALASRNHGFLQFSNADEIMYEHIESWVIGKPLFPPLDMAESFLTVPLPLTFLKTAEMAEWGVALHLPRWVEVYDSHNPGPMVSRISSKTPLWLVNAGIPEERCNVKIDQNMTESDIEQAKDELESTPYPLCQYRRISLKWITIGNDNNKRAIEHIHVLEQAVPKKLRQIWFVHRNRGYVFTFSTSPERYEIANKWFFEPVISLIEFC